MEVIFSNEFQRQLDIVRLVADKGNIDFYALYNRIGLCVKALELVDCIDDIPFELRFHKSNQDKIGHLGDPLEKCLSVDLDGTNRFLTFEVREKAVVVTSLGHYNISLVEGLWDEKTLFKSNEEIVNDFNDDQLLDVEFEHLKIQSEPTKQALLNSVKDIELTDTIIHSFDSNLKKDICPLNPDSVKCRLISYLSNWEQQYKQDNNIRKLRPEDSKVRDIEVRKFVDKYTSVLERATVNARGLSNAASIVCGGKDPNRTIELKVHLDKYLVRSFSNLVLYVYGNVMSIKLKGELFNKMGNAFLRGFDEKYDHTVEVDNEALRKIDKLLRNAVVKDIGNILSLNKKDYSKTIKNTNQQKFFESVFSNYVSIDKNKLISDGWERFNNELNKSFNSDLQPKYDEIQEDKIQKIIIEESKKKSRKR